MTVEEVLQQLAKLRKLVPGIDDVPATRPRSDERLTFRDGRPLRTEADFEHAALLDAVHSLGEDLDAAGRLLDERIDRLVQDAVRTYHLAEELSRDPAHADLIPVLEKLRKSYERDFGKPIPERGEGE
jgi:hypothetical protein